MTTVITLIGKGGSAKTTSTASIGDAIARRGQRVLLVDLDAQSSLSDWLARRRQGPSLYESVVDGVPLADVRIRLRDDLDLVPGAASTTVLLERFIENRPRRRETVIATWLEEQAQDYDLVVLDTPRGLAGPLSLNALEAAEGVIVPLDPGGMGLNALAEQVRLVNLVGEERQAPHLLLGVLPTRVPRTNVAAAAVELVGERGLRVLPGIPSATAAAEAVVVGELLADYAPKSPAVEAYNRVADVLTGLPRPPVVEKSRKKKDKDKKAKKKKGK